MANDFQEFKGQMLGTTDAGETKKVSVDDNGKLKVVIDSESGSGGESGIGLVNIVDQEGNPITTSNPFPVALSGSNTLKGALATVTTAGTEVRLPDYACKEVTIIALKANTGSIYVGGSDVSSTVYGVELEKKESFTFLISNTNLLYIDSSVNGEGISYIAIQ